MSLPGGNLQGAADEFQLLPAIDVRAGRVVRLSQGDYTRQTTYDDLPLAVAQRYAEAGASWLHLVDLDAARTGRYGLQPLLRTLAAELPGLRVQTGGGIREERDVQDLLDSGAARVVVGTVAVREPQRVVEWLARFGAEHLTLALDARQDASSGCWRLASHGWTQSSGQTLDATLQIFADVGARHLLCTDITRDGMLGGFNIELYRHLSASFPGLCIQASGGVRDLADIAAARAAGASAAVLGRSLLEKRYTLEAALAC